MKKKLVTALVAGAMLTSVAFGVSANAADNLRFTFLVTSLDGVWAEVIDAMEKECDERGIDFAAKETYSSNDKITAIENLTLSGCDVMLIQVDDAESLQPYLETAQANNIKVIAIDTATETCDAFWVCENYDYGYAIGTNAGNWIKETFGTEEEVEVAICNAPFLPFLVTREEGVRQAVTDIAPNAVFVAEAAAGGTLDEGVTAGETWIQSNPNIKCVVGVNDLGPLGVANAFIAAGKTGDDIGLFGGDALEDALDSINNDGIFRGTVSTGIVSIVPEMLDVVEELAEKGSTEKKENYFPLTPITKENIADFIK